MNIFDKKKVEKKIVVDGHNHMMMDILQRRHRGEKANFSRVYAPLAKKSGVNIILTNVGGDNFGITETDYLLLGTISVLDTLLQEAEESADTMAICYCYEDIEKTILDGKVAVLMTMEGARPLEGRPHRQTLSVLRMLYKLGLRAIQLVDNGRNRLCDGKAESQTKGGLTNFGISVVKEMNRLGMIIDVAHISTPGFWDVIEISDQPIIDSHSNAYSIRNHLRNLTDEQIVAIAKKGGMIGLTFNSDMTADNEQPTSEDLIKHIDYIKKLVGIDYVGLGPDFCPPHYGPLSETPGILEGLKYTAKKTKYIDGAIDIAGISNIANALNKHGYKEDEIRKVLGENWLRIYRKIIG